ncbi:2470_t:CDS:2, partial [Ambispora gerdemannii]
YKFPASVATSQVKNIAVEVSRSGRITYVAEIEPVICQEKYCEETFGGIDEELPSIQKEMEKFTKKINRTPVDNLSSVIEEAQKESFNAAWKQMKVNYGGEEPPYFSARAIYKINFPPSLWNELTEKQQESAKKDGHVRGEQNPNNPAELDNNSLFYGAPRTGKSIMAEKLAYEADIYPLVVIQGSTLTPNKSDTNANVTLLLKFIFTVSAITHDLVNNFGYERDKEDGEASTNPNAEYEPEKDEENDEQEETNDDKEKKDKKRKLELKGKTIDQAREDNKKAQAEADD